MNPWIQGLGGLLAQAGQAGGPAGTATGSAPSGGIMQMLILFGPLIFLFYFLILRPQQKEQKKRQAMIDDVAKGDQIVTVGGMHGTVEGVDLTKQEITLAIAPKVSVRINKSAVASVKTKGKEKGKGKGKGKGGKSAAETGEKEKATAK